jgi:hypothetical protein
LYWILTIKLATSPLHFHTVHHTNRSIMWKGLAKVSSHVKRTPKALTVPVTSLSHRYSTEFIDYVHGIRGGKISGVPSVHQDPEGVI